MLLPIMVRYMRSLAMPKNLFAKEQKMYEKNMKRDRETEKRESCYFQLKIVSQVFAATVRSQSPVVISRAKRHSPSAVKKIAIKNNIPLYLGRPQFSLVLQSLKHPVRRKVYSK